MKIQSVIIYSKIGAIFMNLYYTEIIFIVVFSLIILELIASRNDILSKEKKKQLKTLYIFIIIASISEWLGVFLNGQSQYWSILHAVVKATEYSIVPFLPIIFVDILDKHHTKNVFVGISIVHAFIEFSSIFSHLTFYIDSSNIYQHGSFY